MPLHVSSTCAHRQEVKIVLYSLWYHHTYRCDVTRGRIVHYKIYCIKLVNIKINISSCTASKISKFVYANLFDLNISYGCEVLRVR